MEKDINPIGEIKKVLLTPSPQVDEMVRAIMEKNGYKRKSDIYFEGVRLFHSKLFKDYIEVRKEAAQNNKKPILSEDEEAEQQVRMGEKRQEAKRKIEEKGQAKLCAQLGGEAIEGTTEKICKFNNYHYHRIYEEKVPFSHLSQVLVENQYNPSREVCEQAIKDNPENKQNAGT